VLSRSHHQGRGALFNAAALTELLEAVEVCDEVFHEAARGVLVAYDRLKTLKLASYKQAKSGEKIELSFDERVRWPLFQKRVSSMMGVLMDAKSDVMLHLLVYWARWEDENRRRCVVMMSRDLTMHTDHNRQIQNLLVLWLQLSRPRGHCGTAIP
jgi:hypothetical protein